jgi:hypothetical protein
MDISNPQIQFEYKMIQTITQMYIGRPVETHHDKNKDL